MKPHGAENRVFASGFSGFSGDGGGEAGLHREDTLQRRQWDGRRKRRILREGGEGQRVIDGFVTVGGGLRR